MNFYIFNNGIVSEKGMSGSDKIALECMPYFLERGKICLIIPRVGFKRYEKLKNNPKVSYTITSGLSVGKIGVFPLYLWRALKTIFLVLQFRLDKDSVIYSTCDLIPDSIPAFFARLKNNKAKWVCGMHLLAPNPFLGFIGVETDKFHMPSLRDLYYFFSQKFVMFLLKHFASLILVPNQLNKKQLEKLGFSPDKVIVAYGGVNLQSIPKNQIDKKYEACFVGRFHAQKGIFDLISAWELVCQKYKNAKLAIVGEGGLEGEIRKKIQEKRLEKNIVLLGFLDGQEKFETIQSSQIGLFPSTYESFGLVALELMACGVPVVAYDLPVYKEIYNQGMVKVPIGKVGEFAQKTIWLLDDELERKKIGEQGKKLVLNFTWEKTARKILEKLS